MRKVKTKLCSQEESRKENNRDAFGNTQESTHEVALFELQDFILGESELSAGQIDLVARFGVYTYATFEAIDENW